MVDFPGNCVVFITNSRKSFEILLVRIPAGFSSQQYAAFLSQGRLTRRNRWRNDKGIWACRYCVQHHVHIFHHFCPSLLINVGSVDMLALPFLLKLIAVTRVIQPGSRDIPHSWLLLRNLCRVWIWWRCKARVRFFGSFVFCVFQNAFRRFYRIALLFQRLRHTQRWSKFWWLIWVIMCLPSRQKFVIIITWVLLCALWWLLPIGEGTHHRSANLRCYLVFYYIQLLVQPCHWRGPFRVRWLLFFNDVLTLLSRNLLSHTRAVHVTVH